MNTIENRVANFATSTFGRYRRELHRYLMRRLRQPQDVDDLAQEVYLRLLRLDDGRFIHKPLAYLYGIASHVLSDFRIHDNEMADAIHRCDPNEDWSEQPACVLPDDLADRLNLQQQIDCALAQLPPTHAAVLLCHKRDGLSYTETAEKLGLSEHTVAKYVTQGKARIRTMSWER
jgi:RNA polymerase sigma-70 factor (ECF subfamily)